MWKIKPNKDKTKAIIISKKRTPNIRELTIQNTPIPYENSIKYLGIHIDKKLTWKPHVDIQLQRANNTLGRLHSVVKRNSRLSLKNKTLIYTQIIRPQLLYGCMAFSQLAKTHRKKLQTFQNKVLRRLTTAPWFIRNSNIHKDLKIPRVKDFLQNKQQKFLDKISTHRNPLLRNTFDYDPHPQTGRHKNLKTPIT